MFRQLLYLILIALLLPACVLRKGASVELPVRSMPVMNAAGFMGYTVQYQGLTSECLVQAIPTGNGDAVLSVNHRSMVFRSVLPAAVRSNSRQLMVDFCEDTTDLMPAAPMFLLSDSVLAELTRIGSAQLELVKPYRTYEADGSTRMELESRGMILLHVLRDTLMPIMFNGSPVLMRCWLAEGAGSRGTFRLYFSGEEGNRLILGWDYGLSVRLTWVEQADALPDPFALQPGSELLFLYNHPVMLHGMLDYVDDTLYLRISRADSLLQGSYHFRGPGVYARDGRFSYERGRGDDATMRMIPEYSMEDCARFGLDCGNWFLRGAQWNSLLYRGLVMLELNEFKDAQQFVPQLNAFGNYRFTRSLASGAAPVEFCVFRLKDRMSEAVMDVLPNRDYPMVVYWQQGTESLELVQVIHSKGRKNP